ncbi:hypothetical protein EYF80_009446 [Liparis tanakae]|uniref:Uncharacterized protein n=1 Tax=Liparis tanakae TaxID=230148 RepID=A0A4Z2ISZ9_9TELE|nr:hypothetical protein EYF80_009446 [Liparis tanakae]
MFSYCHMLDVVELVNINLHICIKTHIKGNVTQRQRGPSVHCMQAAVELIQKAKTLKLADQVHKEVQPQSSSVAEVIFKSLYIHHSVLSPPLSPAFVINHHATELALMFAGLLPHDGAAGGGGAAWHGCCRAGGTWERGEGALVRGTGVKGPGRAAASVRSPRSNVRPAWEGPEGVRAERAERAERQKAGGAQDAPRS